MMPYYYGKKAICDLGYRGEEVREGMICIPKTLSIQLLLGNSRAMLNPDTRILNERLKTYKCTQPQGALDCAVLSISSVGGTHSVGIHWGCYFILNCKLNYEDSF
jgi:hypothetical protein